MYQIILRPLSDVHLPYLYKWSSDPEVLYWTEGEDVESYPPEIVHKKYGGMLAAEDESAECESDVCR